MGNHFFNIIMDMLDELPVVSSHEHHLPDAIHRQMSLDKILDYSYIGWYAGRKNKPFAQTIQEDPLLQVHKMDPLHALPDDDWSIGPQKLAAQRAEFLDKFGVNSYWVWLERGIQKIYGLREPISPKNWESVSRQITHKHSQPLAHLDIMREHGVYQHAVQDTYWDYSSDLAHPDFFSPAMRTDMFVTCSSPGMRDHDLNNPFITYPDAPRDDLDDYLEYLKKRFTTWRENGAAALKCASAYERPLQFGEPDREGAARVFGQPLETLKPGDRLAFGDFMFHWFCELAQELDVPFQVHTGLADLAGSNPMLFQPVIKRYPAVTFVLFHIGYPWYQQIAGLAHNHSNVYIDMVWAPLISTTASVHALAQYLEAAQTSDSIGWGSDAWTAEEAVGAVLAWKHVIARVLADKLESGYLNMAKAESLASKWMYINNARLYGFPPSR